jgi:hypothetical protein
MTFLPGVFRSRPIEWPGEFPPDPVV